MKNSVKLLTLLLACLILVTGLVACGGETDTETQPKGTETKAPDTDVTDEGGYDASFNRSSVADDIPTNLKFDGKTVTFFTRNDSDNWKYEMDVDELLNNTLYDAIYYRNKTVEERLGVTITTIQQAGDFANRVSWNDTLRTAVNTKTSDFDAAAIYLSTGTPLAVENIYYNVIDFPYINLEKPFWNQNLREELTMFNTLYYLAGDIAVTELTDTYSLLYNKNIFEKYYGASGINLYDVVQEGKWTIDYMYELSSKVHEDNNNDGVISDGDLVGYRAADPNAHASWNDVWIAACGIDITTMVNGVPELSFYNDRTVRAFEMVKRLSLTSPGTLAMKSPQTTTFDNGLILFAQGTLNSGSSLREMKDAYGILPVPMLEENQEGGYATTVGNAASLITILSSLSNDRKELVGATLTLMAAESYKQVAPAYFEVALKTKYAESPEDSAIYDLILNSVHFSFGYCYSTQSLKGGAGSLPIGGLFRVANADLAKEYEANADVYEENLQKLLDGLDEAAFKAMMGQ